MPNGCQRFSVTQYHYDDKWIKEIQDSKLFIKWVWQEEKCPDTGRLHLQCYFHTKSRVTFKKLKVMCKFDHIERAYKSEATNFKYCTKEESATGAYQMQMLGSEWTREVKRNKKRKANEALIGSIKEGATVREVAQEYPHEFLRHNVGIASLVQHHRPTAPPTRPVTVILLKGPTGVGKSYWARQLAHYHRMTLYSKIIQAEDKTSWFDGYTDQNILLFDDFGRGQVGFRQFLTYLDIYALKVQTKGGTVDAAWNTVIITSNEEPSSWFNQYIDIAPLLRRITVTHECKTPYAVSYVDFKTPLVHKQVPVFEEPPEQDIKREIIIARQEHAIEHELDGYWSDYSQPASPDTQADTVPLCSDDDVLMEAGQGMGSLNDFRMETALGDGFGQVEPGLTALQVMQATGALNSAAPSLYCAETMEPGKVLPDTLTADEMAEDEALAKQGELCRLAYLHMANNDDCV